MIVQNRYTAFTLDGSPIFHAGTAQQIGDGVAPHLAEDRRPHIAYTYDAAPGVAYPFTVWVRRNGETVGTPCRTFDAVCKAHGL
jgi:hypothetical protein